MAWGEHWEWRGFAPPPEGPLESLGVLRERFQALPELFGPQEVTDRYLWVPGLRLNAKLRVGAEDGLKLKRRVDAAGTCERWLEDPDEVFLFPLDRRAWDRLAFGLGLAGFEGAELPPGPTDLRESLEILGEWEASLEIVEVRKRRTSRRLDLTEGSVSVEWAVIARPERAVSIGLEELGVGGSHPDAGLEAVRAARDELGLAGAGLRPMSYLDAVDIWARGERLFEDPPGAVGGSPASQ